MLEAILSAYAKYEKTLQDKQRARDNNRQKHQPDRGADLAERLRGH